MSNHEPIPPGYKITAPKLRKTLQTIRDKPDDFYTGNLAEQIVKDVTGAGGIFTLDDLANYKVKTRKVISSYINNLKMHTVGAPSGGPTVTQILNILRGI